MHPDFYTGQRMVKPPVVYNAGLLRDAGRVHQQHDLVEPRPGRRPAALLPARRRRLGLHALARTRRRSGPAGSWRRSCRARGTPAVVAERSRRSSSQRVDPVLGLPDRLARRPRTCSPPSPRRSSPARTPPRSSRRRCGGSSPPPPTSRPHELRLPRLQPQRLRPARGRRGRQRPAGDRAGHADPGRDRALAAATSSRAAPGSRSPSTAAAR